MDGVIQIPVRTSILIPASCVLKLKACVMVPFSFNDLNVWTSHACSMY